MPDLIAQGPNAGDRWRRAVAADRPFVVGRTSSPFAVTWDEHVSRRHAELSWRDGVLDVRRLPDARNPIFVQGRQKERFSIHPGEHFVIGATTFTLVEQRASPTLALPRPADEQTFSARYLQSLRFRQADERIDVLARLPEIVTSASSDKELFTRLVSLLLAGVPRASSAALVAARGSAADASGVEILHWDRRDHVDTTFTPSATLIRKAVETSESVVHVWAPHSTGDAPFTQSEGADWACCTPVAGGACRGWAIYLAGHFTGSESADVDVFSDDLKFTELVATTLSGLREVRRLERMNQFFSPAVVDAFAGQDPDLVLAPREADVAVLFCDLRGFSRRSERDAHDLLGLLNRVSQALGVMTHAILEYGGVIGDFHGDAAMGFWGWPLAQADAVERACRAALVIRRQFQAAAERLGDPLSDFNAGIGIASGRAVAGKIGTVDQVKVTVFGPVVNLAARLEQMTKRLQAPILLDETTARLLRAVLPADVGRLRRIARIRPAGMETALEVSELLPPAAEMTTLSDRHIAAYERALDALLVGRWDEAFQLLHQVPAEDRVKDFLTIFIAQHNRTPPPNWDGAISLQLG